MSTPSVTILKNLVLNWESNQMEEETIATFYRHYDGYPSCHAIDIASSLVVASRSKPEHIDFSGASVERDILNNRNWCQHFLKAMCMADADIEFIGEDNVPSASYTYVVTGAYDNFGGKVSIGAEEYVIVNNFYAYGTLDRQLVEYLEGEGVPIIAKIPRAVALSRAAAAGVSVAEYDPKSHVVAPIELLADSVLNEEEKNNG